MIKKRNVTKGIAKNHLQQAKQSRFTYFLKKIIQAKEWVFIYIEKM